MASPPLSYRMALRWATCSTSSRVSISFPSLGMAAWHRSSTALMALRTSPPQAVAICRGTSCSQSRGRGERSCSIFSARRTAGSTSSGDTALNSNTVLRDSRAPYT